MPHIYEAFHPLFFWNFQAGIFSDFKEVMAKATEAVQCGFPWKVRWLKLLTRIWLVKLFKHLRPHDEMLNECLHLDFGRLFQYLHIDLNADFYPPLHNQFSMSARFHFFRRISMVLEQDWRSTPSLPNARGEKVEEINSESSWRNRNWLRQLRVVSIIR